MEVEDEETVFADTRDKAHGRADSRAGARASDTRGAADDDAREPADDAEGPDEGFTPASSVRSGGADGEDGTISTDADDDMDDDDDASAVCAPSVRHGATRRRAQLCACLLYTSPSPRD